MTRSKAKSLGIQVGKTESVYEKPESRSKRRKPSELVNNLPTNVPKVHSVPAACKEKKSDETERENGRPTNESEDIPSKTITQNTSNAAAMQLAIIEYKINEVVWAKIKGWYFYYSFYFIRSSHCHD